MTAKHTDPPSSFEASPSLIDVLNEAQSVGAIGPAPLREHINHAAYFCSAFSNRLPTAGRLLDLGSGGGLPGLVIAECAPQFHVTLLDGRRQRTEHLHDAIIRLNASDRIDVVPARAEEAGRDPVLRNSFDVVVARGFGSPPVTAECAAPFLRVGGILIVSEPPGAPDRWPVAGCAEVGLVPEATCQLPWSYVLLRQFALCPERYPRRVGIPGKRPIFSAR